MQAAIDQAAEDVNAATSVLSGVTLEIVTGDSECREGPAIKAFIDAIGDKAKPLHGVMTGCSSGSGAIAGIAPLYHLPQVSGISSAGGLSDTTRFPRFLRTMNADTYFAQTWVKLCARYGWKRAAVLAEVGASGLYSATAHGFNSRATAAGIDVTVFDANMSPGTTDAALNGVVQTLAATHTRIVFFSASELLGARLLCRASKAGLAGRASNVVWVTVGWHKIKWWRLGATAVPSSSSTSSSSSPSPSSSSLCSVADMDAAAEGYLSTEALTLGADDKDNPIKTTGVLPSAWWDAYVARSKVGTHNDGPTV